MKKALTIGATIGFLMPIVWGFASFVLFNLPEGRAANLYWSLNHTFCPFYRLPTVIELPFTAGLYAGIAIVVAIVIRGFRSRKIA